MLTLHLESQEGGRQSIFFRSYATMAAVAAWDLMPFLLFGSSSALSIFVALKSSSVIESYFPCPFCPTCFQLLSRSSTSSPHRSNRTGPMKNG